MDYKNCKVPAGALKRIVYTDDRLQVQENLLTADNLLTGNVAARLKHFSRYAIAY
jgi:HJR/Mrr/RecB family endonuclease